MPSSDLCCLLTDNGSLRPEATFSLRRLACDLGEAVGAAIQPVSLLHSSKIPAAKLDGRPAETFEPFLLARRMEGIHRFHVTPLFFGPSAAFMEFLPQRVDAIRDEHAWPELEVRVAPCVVDVSAPDDLRIAQILGELITAKADERGLERAAVAVCDHGAPRIKVTEVRNFLAWQLRTVLGDRFAPVGPCSMERREGDDYRFNEPLLEHLLGSPGFTENVIVSMLFFQPGRHAGPGGDIAQICSAAEERCPGLATHMTDLVASHPGLIPVLAERFQQGMNSIPVSWDKGILPAFA